MIKVTVDGISFDVEDEQLGQAIIKQQKAHDEEKEVMKKKEEEDEEEKKELKKEKETADAERDIAVKTILSDAQINDLVTDRAELLYTVKSILGDKMLECTNCDKELKTAVIDHVLDIGIKDWTPKSMDYVDASFDIAVKHWDKASESLKKFGNDLSDEEKLQKKKRTEDRKSAQLKYQKDHLGLDIEEEV